MISITVVDKSGPEPRVALEVVFSGPECRVYAGTEEYAIRAAVDDAPADVPEAVTFAAGKVTVKQAAAAVTPPPAAEPPPTPKPPLSERRSW